MLVNVLVILPNYSQFPAISQNFRLSANKKKTCNPNGLQVFVGGDKRDRTADLLNAIQALSQLSYTPMLPETLDFAGFLSYSIF